MNLLIILIFIFNIQISLGFYINRNEEQLPLLRLEQEDIDFSIILDSEYRFINIPNEIKLNIFEYVDIKDIVYLPQVNKNFHKLFFNRSIKKYEDFKKVKILKMLTDQEQIFNLNNPLKIIKLLSLLNRLKRYQFDLSSININKIIKQCSLLRFSPTFLLLGGTNKLTNVCEELNIDIKTTYESKFKTFAYSLHYDHFALPITFICLTTTSLPFIIKKYNELYYKNKEIFNSLALYNATSLNSFERNNIHKCSKESGIYIADSPPLKIYRTELSPIIPTQELNVILHSINQLINYGDFHTQYNLNDFNEQYYLYTKAGNLIHFPGNKTTQYFYPFKTSKNCLYKSSANSLVIILSVSWSIIFISFCIYKIVVCGKKQKKLSILN